MPEEEKALRKNDPKVRLRKDLYDAIGKIADKGRFDGVKMVSIVDEAVETWLKNYRGRHSPEVASSGEAALTRPQRELVDAAVKIIRNPKATMLSESIYSLLRTWIEHEKKFGSSE